MRGAARALWRSPAGKILCAALLLRVAGLFWGLPASDGWDDDGVAPRDFLVSVLETYRWGHHATYPPLQMILLSIETAPVWIAALLRAPSLAPAAVVAAFVRVPTMTALAVAARATTIAMSLGILWSVAGVGRRIGGSARAGALAAACCASCSVFTYYSQTSNLDVPYLFWSALALGGIVRAIAAREPRAIRGAIVLAALAVCTKDQAYAVFLLAVPLALAAWPAIDARARPLVPAIARELAIGAAAGIAVLLVVDGAVVNPPGFAARVRFLLGPASQDHAMYAASAIGRLHAARDAALGFGRSYPWAFAPLAAAGIAAAWRAGDRSVRAAGLVPLLAAASFTVAFDMAARRTEDRFLLPQMLMLGIYAGLGLDALWSRLEAGGRAWAFAAVAAPCFALALFRCAAVDAAMLLDPRYDAERWLRAHAAPGDRLEVYDNNVQLPRLPPGLAAERVGLTPPSSRNPMSGLTEVQGRFSDVEARRPRWILLSEFWASKYLLDPADLTARGRALSPQQARARLDVDSGAYFRDLRGGRLGYRLAHVSAPAPSWPRVDIHESLDRTIWIYERSR